MSAENESPQPLTTAGPSDEVYRVLAGVMEDQAHKARVRREMPVPGTVRTGPVTLVALLLLTLLSAYLWIFPPGWLSPPVASPQSSRLVEAGMKMEVYIQASTVDEFREREGRLPNTLAEAGDPFSAVVYERLDADRYRMTLTGPQGVVLYLSTTPLQGFLGDAPQVIREGG